MLYSFGALFDDACVHVRVVGTDARLASRVSRLARIEDDVVRVVVGWIETANRARACLVSLHRDGAFASGCSCPEVSWNAGERRERRF